MKEKSSPKWREHAQLLLRKAQQDEYVLDCLLTVSDAPLEVFGFHAQQAGEKLLKAGPSLFKREYPRTHRLSELMDLFRVGTLPEQFDELHLLTPFAAEFRYDVVPEEAEEALDKQHVRKLIAELRQWLTMIVDAGQSDEGKRSP